MRLRIVLGLGLLVVLSVPAWAHGYRSDAAVERFGAFQKPEAIGRGLTDRATYAGGFLASYRYHFNHWSALEVNYGYTRFTQRYVTASGSTRVQANAHEATLAYVFTPPRLTTQRIRPFFLAGTGVLVLDPTGDAGGRRPARSSRTARRFSTVAAWTFSRCLVTTAAVCVSATAGSSIGHRASTFRG